MEKCVFVKGKRKLLSESIDGDSSMTRKRLSRSQAFHRFMFSFDQLIDSTISNLYANVLSKIADFVRSEWLSTHPHSGLATGIVRCENLDGLSLSQSLTALLDTVPLCISMPVPPLCTIVEAIHKNQKPKCLILKQLECLPAGFVDNLISVLSDPNWHSQLVILMTISADISVVFSCCSAESYAQLYVRQFEFPAPVLAMNTFLDAVTFHSHFGLRVDGKLFDELRTNFLERSFSINQLRKMLRLAAVNFFADAENLEFDVQECSSPIGNYVVFLHILYDLCEGLPQQPDSVYDLHSDVQSKSNFFSDRNGSFWRWKSVWLTWEADEISVAINKVLPHVKELDDGLHAELQKLLVDVNQLEARKCAIHEKIVQQAPPTACGSETKMSSHFAMQQRMKERMAVTKKKKLDPFVSDRQHFVKLLTKVFEMVLKPFDAIDALNKGLLRGGGYLSKLTMPSIAEHLEESLMGKNPHLRTGQSQADLCVAYRTLQNMALHMKNIPIVEWVNKFEEQISPLEGIDSLTRLYKCIADLEIMGVIKAVSDNCITAVHLLQPPSTTVVGVE